MRHLFRSLWSAVLLLAGIGSQGAPGTLLVNGGFEETNVLSAWRAWIYADGKAPTIRADSEQAKEGGYSLLISADEPADVALGQVVTLPPGSVWRVHCSIRTEKLVARDRTETGGALHVQTPDGGTLARSASAFGSTPWHEASVPFRVPGDGRVKVVLFYIGYGKGTGKAWFDDVRLEEIVPGDNCNVRITTERLTRLPVDAKQGGQFIEPLCNLIPSLLAQQVANTSFEEESPWKIAFRREVDKPHRPWYPDGAVHLARYSLDTNRPANGRRSLKIELPVAGAHAGISQDGFYFREKRAYRLRLQARSEGSVRVRATLHGGGCIAARKEMGQTQAEWKTVEISLRSSHTLENATLTLDFAGAGTLWLDRVSLTDEEAVLGLWRPDVVRVLRELKPGVLRFGGSTLEEYEWDQCLGPRDRRAPFPLSYWGGLEENFVGVEEFVALCHEIGAEPLVCVRWTGKKPQDAAGEVEYFNGGVGSKWGALRAKHGHPEPWRVKYWQIGNEVGGAEYERTLRSFAEAMRRVDPGIRILSSFPSRDILRAGGGQLDYLCPHHYGCADLAGMEADFTSLGGQIRRESSPRTVRVAVTEWNTTAGDWELGRASLQTLGNALACSRYHNLMHRHADLVEIAIRSNLIDSFCSGVIQTGPNWLYLAPTYYAQQLYSRAAGSYPVRMERVTENSSQAAVPWYLAEPDLSALLSPDGRTLRLYGINSTGKSLTMRTTLSGMTANGRTPVYALRDSETGRTAETLNTRDEPQRVRIFERTLGAHGARLELMFEPFSVTLYEFPLKPAKP